MFSLFSPFARGSEQMDSHVSSRSKRATDKLVFLAPFSFFSLREPLALGLAEPWRQSSPSTFLLSGPTYSKVLEISLEKGYYSQFLFISSTSVPKLRNSFPT